MNYDLIDAPGLESASCIPLQPLFLRISLQYCLGYRSISSPFPRYRKKEQSHERDCVEIQLKSKSGFHSSVGIFLIKRDESSKNGEHEKNEENNLHACQESLRHFWVDRSATQQD